MSFLRIKKMYFNSIFWLYVILKRLNSTKLMRKSAKNSIEMKFWKNVLQFRIPSVHVVCNSIEYSIEEHSVYAYWYHEYVPMYFGNKYNKARYIVKTHYKNTAMRRKRKTQKYIATHTKRICHHSIQLNTYHILILVRMCIQLQYVKL